MPLIISLPMLSDPVSECYDLELEAGYNQMMLGLGDILIPGLLVAYCFYVDTVRGNPRYPYGIIALLGE